jgi:tRNA(fMet)-specific endonuclease VapC
MANAGHAPPRYMLDTDTVSYLLRGKYPPLDARIRSAPTASLCISVVTRAELLLGLELKPQAQRLATLIDQFLQRVPSLPWTDSAAASFAKLSAKLLRAGTPIGSLDAMIAAHALAENAILVTNNTRHFSRIAVLRRENWLK